MIPGEIIPGAAPVELFAGATLVELTVAPEAAVGPSLRVFDATAKRELRAALPVVVHTVTGKTTLDAILGTSGALAASRVSPAR